MTGTAGRAVPPFIFVSIFVLGTLLNPSACSHSTRVGKQTLQSEGSGSPVDVHPEIAEILYENGLKNQWQDFGWAPRELSDTGPAKVRFNDYGGWILAKPGLSGSFGGVVFRVKEPPGEGEFLEVWLEGEGRKLAHVKVAADDAKDIGDGWTEVFLPMDRLNPGGIPFDHVVIQAFRSVGDDWVPINGVGLVRGSPKPPSVAAATTSPVVRAPQNAKPVAARILCDGKAIKISPLIYGVGGTSIDIARALGATILRWGGNPTTTYNYQQRAWNVGKDWFYENHSAPAYTQFLSDNASHQTASALTIPMLGWVAKDTSSYGFPVSLYGPQAQTDPSHSDAGNGLTPSGAKITPFLPPRAGVSAPPAWVKQWVSEIAGADAKSGKRSVTQYILDNEPMLWHDTHRSMRPDPLGYDELVERAIEYGTAVREADPTAVIAGPAEWGWTGYFYSAKDIAEGGSGARPDRRAHGDIPLVEWYLKQLREHERKAGVRILDVLDLHYYPQADKVYGSASDSATSALRLRSTRSLWDKTYVDESWIKDSVALLPRMRGWVDKNYPGLGLSIGEWNFGGEGHVSGAIAIAETLGRFAQFGVSSAYYWTAPPPGSPGAQGFLAYRNFDGTGGRFLDWYLPTSSDAADLSLFASRDEAGKHVVLVLLNLSSDVTMRAQLDTGSCGALGSRAAYAYVGGTKFESSKGLDAHSATLEPVLPPLSITVVDLGFEQAIPGVLQR